ncbi:MAG TPA: hypothetical protein VE046_12815 [Steroidobacteraceae bacterium]|nr:hypothetical protein [Steroidobacteraceae bacterium]
MPAPAADPAPPAASTTAGSAAKPFKPPSGYRAKKLGANTVYCKQDTMLGSRFPTEICLTEDELREVEFRGEEMRRDKQKSSPVCGGGGSCGN